MVCLLGARLGGAQSAVLIAAADPTQVEVEVAKVMADETSVWMSVLLTGRTRLAVVTSQASSAEPASAEAWLRALDFATRVRVAAPMGASSSCTATGAPRLADSGLPEPAALHAKQVWSSETELDLSRRLADVGLTVDVASAARFSAVAAGPYRVALYEVPDGGGNTPALRLTESGHALELPRIDVVGIESVPLSFIALANGAVLPPNEPADPSEFPSSYRAATTSTDYASARRKWRAENRDSWLSEASGTSALYAFTVFADGQIMPAVAHYFQATSPQNAAACEHRVQAAVSQGSRSSADYACDGADDLAQSSSALGFETPRLTRLYGSTSRFGARLRVRVEPSRLPRVVATEFDGQGCPPVSIGAAVISGGESSAPPPTTSEAGGEYYGEPQPAYQSDGSCNVTVFADSCSGDSSSDASPNDSCSGDTSSSPPSGDSCSGNASGSDSNRDSCSGSTSSSDSSPDSCSGSTSSGDTARDSCSGNSDSSNGSSGCGKNEYNGDTCSGNSSSSSVDSAASSSSAALHTQTRRPSGRPRPVHLSLLTLLAAALALPLRRRAAWR